ncbi:hypothetical protein STEG23_032567 [Scotinomys teguina]
MFLVKVKVEKSEMEMDKARNQLDAILQCLLEKSHMDSLALGHSSSFPCPAFGAIAKSVSFICRLTHIELPKLLPSGYECTDPVYTGHQCNEDTGTDVLCTLEFHHQQSVKCRFASSTTHSMTWQKSLACKTFKKNTNMFPEYSSVFKTTERNFSGNNDDRCHALP